MKKVLIVVCSFILVALSVAFVHAQEAEALTQTFTAADGSYSFQNPDDWDLMDFGAQGITLYVHNNLGTLTGAVALIPDSTGQTPEKWLAALDISFGGKLTSLQIAGYQAAMVQTELGQAFAFAAPGGFLMRFDAHSDVIKQFEPTIMAVLATVQIKGAPASAAAQPTATEATTSATQTGAVGSGELVFPGVDGGYSDLFTSDPDGQNVKQLTQQQLHTLLPVWSPDGTMIAYISDTSTTGTDAYDVFVIPSGGGEARKITATSSLERGAVAWSPDSKQLLFIAHRELGTSSQMYTIKADGSDEQKLSIDVQTLNDYALDWSPDGQHIGFMAFVNSQLGYALVIANADGSSPTPIPNISNIAQVGEYFKWSPDGQHGVISDTSSLTVTAADGSSPNIILPATAGLTIGGVSWSPDSRQLAFTATGSDPTLLVYTINSDGSNQQKVDLGAQQAIWGGISWGGLSTTTAAPSATASETPASASGTSSTCTITAAKGANLRSGPGTTFARAGALAAGAAQSAVGQAKGSDGFVWWKLDDSSWVRSDLVQASSDCAALPTVAS